MSDIYCKCGEPWDLDCLHEYIADNHERSEWLTDGKYDQKKYDVFFKEARQEFREKGCEMFGTKHGDINPLAGELMAIADDVMGDDVDGIISMMEDAEALGLF